jgi:glycosyl transferase family 25
MHAIVISLTNALERRQIAQSEMTRSGLSWEFLDAIDGRLLQNSPPEYNSKKVKALQGFELTPSEVGCFLSHRAAWRWCIELNQNVLVLEDDFHFLPHLQEVLSTLDAHPGDWDIVRLQALVDTGKTEYKNFGTFRLIHTHGDPLGATAYIISPQSAKILLNRSSSIFEPLDHYLEHKARHGLEVLACHPYPVTITGAPTTIADRPGREPINGMKKRIRSWHRMIDRLTNPDPWFPKK